MKKLLALLSLLLCSSALHAQKLIVLDFKPEPTDQTAMNAETQQIDQNGKRAALIRIFTNLKGSDLAFGGSAQGFSSIQYLPGQILLYIPERSQRVTISHPKYEALKDWHWPSAIESGRTYSMRLMVEGKNVSFAASTDGAALIVDGDTIGVSPLQQYLSYGPHSVKAELGTLLYDDLLDITPDGPDSYRLQLEDENLKYGDVTATVAGNADIFFQGRKEAVGEYTFHLKDGVYPVETRKKDHDPRITNITVTAGKATQVELTPPFPHTGYLQLETEPANNVTILAGDTVFTEDRSMQLNVGKYELTFERRGYFPTTRTYSIIKGETLVDTVRLLRKQYVKSAALYAGVGFTYSKMPGVSLKLGGTWKNIDLSASYTFGITKSDPVDWYEYDAATGTTGFFHERARYRMDEAEAKLGYQFSFVDRIGVTPQVGYMMQMLHGDGTKGNGFTCSSVSVGATISYVPIPNLGFFVNPEYAVPISSDELYKLVARSGGFDRGGFHITAGVNFYVPDTFLSRRSRKK